MKTFKKRLDAAYRKWNARQLEKARRKTENRTQSAIFGNKKKKFYGVKMHNDWFIQDGFIVAHDDCGYLRMQTRRLLHRFIYQNKYGHIPRQWVVHHVNKIKTDNRPENLIAIPRWLQRLVHSETRRTKVILERKEIIKLFKESKTSWEKDDEAALPHLLKIEKSLTEEDSSCKNISTALV